MELIQGSETSANYNLTPGKYPEENIQLVTVLYVIDNFVHSPLSTFLNSVDCKRIE